MRRGRAGAWPAVKPFRLHGLPLHPLLVHFPVAAWTVATGLAIIAAFGIGTVPESLARHANAFGLLSGALAMLAGLLELSALPQDSSLRQTVARHVTFAFAAWLAYGFAWLLQVKQMPVAAAATCSAAFVLLALAGHAGGRIVYHHGFPGRTGSP